MAKVISEKSGETPAVAKQVEIKHIRTMKDADGNDVSVVDYSENMEVDVAIKQAEARKASLEAELVDVEAELVEYKKIKDAE
jgi:pyruvate/2-oxoglutarate/acetoin dehydrogenase E1 component